MTRRENRPKKKRQTIDSFSGQYRFLSNFFTHRNFCVEKHYQAAKTTHPTWAARILLAESAGEAKTLGQHAPLREDWEQVKDPVMLTLLRIKFSDSILADALLHTGNALLIEGNTWGDRYWGQVNGEGRNMLGALLMQVRSELKMAEELTEE